MGAASFIYLGSDMFSAGDSLRRAEETMDCQGPEKRESRRATWGACAIFKLHIFATAKGCSLDTQEASQWCPPDVLFFSPPADRSQSGVSISRPLARGYSSRTLLQNGCAYCFFSQSSWSEDSTAGILASSQIWTPTTDPHPYIINLKIKYNKALLIS